VVTSAPQLPSAAWTHVQLAHTRVAFHYKLQLGLTCCRLISEAENQRNVCQWQYHSHFYGKDATLDRLKLSPTLEHYIWANSLVRSRSFGLSVNGEAVTIMAPFLDLANHSTDYLGSFRVSKDQCAF
jgi:hypothetical protein